MRFSKAIMATVLAVACGAAQAQAYRWVDKDGKVRYGDVAPPGVKAKALKAPPSAPVVPPKAASKGDAAKNAAAKGGAPAEANKGPLSPAEQEQAYRERQLKAKEAKEKAAKEAAEAEQLKRNCASAQEGIRSLERGTRVATVNANGETQYLDDAQRAARLTQLRAAASESCK